MNTSEILSAIDQEISRLEQARSLLQSSNGPSAPAVEVKRRGRPPGKATPVPVAPTRTMSEEGRARIAAAQKARWAVKKKADQKVAKAAIPTPAAKKTGAPAKKAGVEKTAALAKVAAKKTAVTVKPPAPKKAAPPAKKAATKKGAPVTDVPKQSANTSPAKSPLRAKPVRPPIEAVTTDAAPAKATAGE